MPDTRAPRLTFARLLELEPRLDELRRAVLSRGTTYGRRRTFCANACWYGYGAFADSFSCRSRLAELVGWLRQPDPHRATINPDEAALQTSEAYEVAYAGLYDVLPSCRRCGCL